MKKALLRVLYAVLVSGVFLLVCFHIMAPKIVVVVKDAGRVISEREFCEDGSTIYEQNGLRKPVELSKDCYRAVKISWCKHPKEKNNCSVDEVVFNHDGYSFPTHKEFWSYGQYVWREYEGRLWPGPDYQPSLRVGDRVNVGYVESKWFGFRTPFDGVKAIKYKE